MERTITTTTETISASDRDFLNGAGGFIARYLRNRACYTRCSEAYEATERQYARLTGHRRYKTLESFKTVYTRYFREKKSARDSIL